jgi:hypothetical protein
MKTIKISEATGSAIDWAVAKCMRIGLGAYEGEMLSLRIQQGIRPTRFSTDWSQGGPIIEREEIGIKRRAPCMKGEEWEAMGSITAKGAGYRHAVGPTPLIAAMRCYVASKLGEEVNVPEELL